MYREKKKTTTEATDERKPAPYKSQQAVREDAHSVWQCQSCHNQLLWSVTKDAVKLCPRCGAAMERKLAPEFRMIPGTAHEQRSDFSPNSTVVSEAQKLGVIDAPLSAADQKIAAMDPGERMRLDVLVLSMFKRKKKPPKDYVSAIESEYKMRARDKEKLGTEEKKIALGLMKHGVKVPKAIL